MKTPQNRRAQIAAVGGLVMVLTACGTSNLGASSGPSPAAPGVVTGPPVTVTATPTPAHWSQKQAAAKYLAMVKPVNVAIGNLGATFDVSDVTWRAVRSKCAALVAANDQFMRSLTAGSWDPSVRPAVDDLLVSSSASHSWWVKCAAAKTREDIEMLGDVTQEDPGSAQRLRVLLGLPSVSG